MPWDVIWWWQHNQVKSRFAFQRDVSEWPTRHTARIQRESVAFDITDVASDMSTAVSRCEFDWNVSYVERRSRMLKSADIPRSATAAAFFWPKLESMRFTKKLRGASLLLNPRVSYTAPWDITDGRSYSPSV